jgi:hypothetical protein
MAIYRNQGYRNKALDVVEAKLTNKKKATEKPWLNILANHRIS